MTPDAILASVVSALDPSAFVAMIVAGLGCGALVFWQSPVTRAGLTPAPLVAFFLGSLGLLFFASRGLALYFDGSSLWPRNVGFALLWLVYIAALLGGIAFRRRFWQ